MRPQRTADTRTRIFRIHAKLPLSTVAALLAVLATAALPVPARAANNGNGCDLNTGGDCARTSGAALHACNNERRDSYWIAVGNCRNLTSGRTECINDARGERDDAQEDCVAQCVARQEVCDALGQDPYDPQIDPANFLSPAEIAANPNPFFPLVPGTVWEYASETETDTVRVTNETREISGVTCITVHDVVDVDGEPIEDTLDWYTQDTAGNVWYFGEIAQNLEDGFLTDIEGSWVAGVDGAKPGIIMEANPQVGDVYRQEFFLGDAEDIGEVISLTGDEDVPAASCNGACLVTADTTPLEPDVLEHKYYLAGVGPILEVDPDTGERNELVSVTTP